MCYPMWRCGYLQNIRVLHDAARRLRGNVTVLMLWSMRSELKRHIGNSPLVYLTASAARPRCTATLMLTSRTLETLISAQTGLV